MRVQSREEFEHQDCATLQRAYEAAFFDCGGLNEPESGEQLVRGATSHE